MNARTYHAGQVRSWKPDDDLDLPCRTAPDLFFAEKPEEIRQARALCFQCQARDSCLDGALQRAEPWGVWGGELILHGAIIPSKRARGRPRSAAIVRGDSILSA